jgi:hypothetical protein
LTGREGSESKVDVAATDDPAGQGLRHSRPAFV